MIVSSMRVSQVSDYYRNVGLLLQNFKEFRKHVKRVQMKINVVCVHDSTARNVTEIVARSHERLLGVSTSVLVNPRMFNKFIFVSEALHDFEVFEKVLLLDSDMDLMGFAIPEYFELVANYVIGGTVHQNVDEMLSKNYDKASRQWFKIFNGAWWQNHAPDVLMFETKFVEQAFVLMDARFAQWFFTRILSEKHLFFTDKAGIKRQRQSDFGPDLLWCEAQQKSGCKRSTLCGGANRVQYQHFPFTTQTIDSWKCDLLVNSQMLTSGLGSKGELSTFTGNTLSVGMHIHQRLYGK